MHKELSKAFHSALVFFWTVGILSISYGAWNGTMSQVSSGSGLTSQGWNAIVNNIDHLKSKTTSVNCPSGQYVTGFDASGNIVCSNPFVNIVANGSGRKWSDNTFATSCNGYRNPASGNYTYSGLTGDGIYTVKPAGSEINVYCDMTSDGGGWTLVARSISTVAASTHMVSSAVSTVLDPGQTFVGKLSDSIINQIAPYSAGNPPVFKQDCQSRVNYYKLAANFDATAAGIWTIQISVAWPSSGFFSVNNSYSNCSKGLQGCDCSTSGCWWHNGGRNPGALFGAMGGFWGTTNGCFYTDNSLQTSAWSNGSGKTWVR